MQSETLAQEFARLVKEYHEGDDQTKPEAWNLLADYAVDNADAISAALSDKQAVEVSCIACEGRPSAGNNPCAVCGRSALVDVPAGVRWRVFEDTTHGWWGIEIDGDEDGEPILYPIKTDRASLDKIADAYNATASTSKLIEERDTARRQAEDQWAGWVKSDCRVRALEAAVRLAIKGIEGADPEVLTDTLWMPEAILKGATVVDVLQGALVDVPAGEPVAIVLPECSEDFVSAGLRHLTAACVAAMPDLDGGYGLGGENGYGVNYENDTFVMRKQWWGDCTCGADDKNEPHKPECAVMLPNFVHKPTGFTVEWYKYIGRGMTVNANGADFLSVLNGCLASLPTSRNALDKERGE